ncbi:hypothetical protein GCM10007906_15620 [Vibrio hyugaensis]|uniref:Uncharacterized protein n=1 Tax=Vibrio hyugaensis TaxID=1534743 RepID=A0ABQ5Y4G3_9VIBR|nr:hypothetical protein GCM10007906_15620 [Vibrio hyugaensis]
MLTYLYTTVAVGALLFKPNNVVAFVELQCASGTLTHTITTMIAVIDSVWIVAIDALIVTTL